MNYSIQADGDVAFEVNNLYEALRQVSGKRKAWGKRYRLATVLTLSVLRSRLLSIATGRILCNRVHMRFNNAD